MQDRATVYTEPRVGLHCGHQVVKHRANDWISDQAQWNGT